LEEKEFELFYLPRIGLVPQKVGFFQEGFLVKLS
jgi:hypothetical protein